MPRRSSLRTSLRTFVAPVAPLAAAASLLLTLSGCMMSARSLRPTLRPGSDIALTQGVVTFSHDDRGCAYIPFGPVNVGAGMSRSCWGGQLQLLGPYLYVPEPGVTPTTLGILRIRPVSPYIIQGPVPWPGRKHDGPPPTP